ncbi:MAG: signal transduction protein [Geobacteraceae bacterium GWC2_55_20]|nr:MAG: signal transduction protein [Geobacteraceae bacterium GWC2_55_20]OGU19240.1 MAG: signal transduction protein [Geobacteraceae bacterium GWF2_54_21]HBA71615.1 signal transduction protein [Geobacter sp.]HCE67110.1 signal transduction protein [Geobacter sp.]
MPDLNALFLTVGNYCRREVITCSTSDRLTDAAATMQNRNISSLVVCSGGNPIGILTDRDLRNKVVAQGIDPGTLSVADVMNSPVITISEDDYLFEALHLISRHRIHRLVVTGPVGELAGIITDSDILRVQTLSPQQLIREIEEAPTVDDLKGLHQRVQGLVQHLIGTGVHIRDLVRLIAHLNDRVVIRLIDLLRAGRFAGLTVQCSFLVLGSEGRGEQTLTTDQDNALVYADDLAAVEVHQLEEFSRVLIDSLIDIGVPSCPGGTMAKNEQWRRSLSQWHSVLDRWFSTPTPEHIINLSMFSDLRILSGDPLLELALKKYINGRLQGNEIYLGHMVANLLRFAVPLGWFGKIKTEKGEHAGQIDLKRAGIFTITEGAKILALAHGVQETGTAQRIERLSEQGVLAQKEADDLTASFYALVHFRLRTQVDAMSAGRQPDNRIRLTELNRMELERLKAALEGVRSFQGDMGRRYRLGQTM